MKTYYPHLDQLKGLAILLMVMAHTLSWSCPDYSLLSGSLYGMTPEVFNASVILKVIYSFHMHLLFFVSGFLFYRQGEIYNAVNVKRQLWKRTQRLLVPYICTGMFVFFLRGYFGYWFFIVLFILNVIVLCELFLIQSCKLSSKYEFLVYAIFFVLLFAFAKVFKDSIPREIPQLSRIGAYYLAFMFGYLIHKHVKIEQYIVRHISQFISFMLYIVLMVIANYWNIIGPVGYFTSLFAIAFLYCYFVNNNSKILGWVGKSSMEIYIFHLFFVMPFPEVGEYILKQTNFPFSITIQLTYSLVISAVAIYFSTIVGKIVKSNKYLSKLILGV